MINVAKYQGIAQFGPDYQVMFENDAHASGSIDRLLMENMIRLCPETSDYLRREYTPKRSFYQKGMRPKLEQHAERAVSGCHADEERIEAITRFTRSLQEKASDELAYLPFGGTEEEIIARGSDWCSDVARVSCTLCQVIGLPARMVYLVNTEQAYSGHVIVEVYRAKGWGAVDPLTDVIYRHLRGKPASTWDLMLNPHLIEHHSRGESTPYTTVSQFREAAISNYFVWRWQEYDYTVSEINDYYRTILEMAEQGWPGGLRWLHNSSAERSMSP